MTNCRRPGPVSGGGDGVTSLNQPPPFLTKTYDIVDDPSTDPIISWGSDGSSFVVWKHSEFARDLLPRHFKHNNFSSFVRQLNTYGFRKVDPDRWEFANESFVRGHKELLRDIHRRKPAAQPNSQSSLVATNQSAIELGNFGGGYGGITDQVDNLKRDKNVLMLEVVRLRQQQQEQSGKIKDLQTRLDTTEQRQHDIMMFLARVAQNPAIIQQLFRAVQASANNVQRITNAKPGTGGQTSPATQATSTSTGQDESTKPAPRKKRRAAGDSDSDTEANSNNSGSAQENNPTAIIQYTPNQNGNFSEFFFKQLGMLSESNSRQDSEMVAQAFHNLSIATTSTVPGAPSVTIQEQPSSSLHAQGSGVLPANPDATFLGPHLVTTGQAQPSASSFTSFPPPLPPSVIHAPAPSSPPLPQSPLGPSLMVTADPTVTMMGLPTAMQIGGGSSSGMSVPMVSESPMMGGVVGTLPSSVEMPSMGSPPHLPVPHISLLGHPLDLPITSNPEVSLPDEMIEDFSMELLGNLQPMSAGSGTADMLSEEMKDEFWNQLFASNEAALHQLSDGSLDLSNVLAHDLVASIIKAEEHPTSGAM